MASKTPYKVGDRVVRVNSGGPLGTVYKVRADTTRTSIRNEDDKEQGLTLTILWDNGTLSHFVPGGLERAQ